MGEVEVLLSLQQSTHSEDSREDNDCEILYHAQMRFISSTKFTKNLNNEKEHIPKGLICTLRKVQKILQFCREVRKYISKF